MAIWFVYRSPYHGIQSKYVRRFDEADTLLDWFRGIWRAIPDGQEAWDHGEKILGTKVYSFGSLFSDIAEHNLATPATMEELHRALEGALYTNQYHGDDDDCIQVDSDDDEVGLAMYWFSDAWARKHPERVAYLMRTDWQLPEVVGPGGFTPKPGLRRLLPAVEGPKSLYLVQLDTVPDMADLCPAHRLPGLRLPDFVPWLLQHPENPGEDLGDNLVYHVYKRLQEVLKEGEGLEASFRQTLLETPDDAVTWAAYSDWLIDHDQPEAWRHLLRLALARCSAGVVTPQVGPHHAAVIVRHDEGQDDFEQWYLFDDCWASGNEDLANALLDYQCRFNVLDDWDERNDHGPDIPAGEEQGPRTTRV